MAGVLGNIKVVFGLRWIYDKFQFWCKKLGWNCNATSSGTFTEAKCDVQPIYGGEGQGGLSVDFVSLFETGFRLISELKHGKRKQDEIEDYFKKAFEILENFMESKSTHEESINNLLKNGDKVTEADVTIALAEHLLAKLAPGQSYTIDTKHRNIPDRCTCGCGAEIKFGNTGIGHEKVWHGHVDILFSSHEGLEPETAVVTVSDIKPVVKKPKQAPDQRDRDSDNEDSSDENFAAEVGSDLNDNIHALDDFDDSICINNTESQTVAKAIVFSLLQKSKRPQLKPSLIPTIVISHKQIKIIMYDAENDVLLQSPAIDIFVNETGELSKLTSSCIVILWMVLHYRIFCSGLKEYYLNKIKSGFTNKISSEYTDIYKSKLKSCVGSFPTVKRRRYNEDNIGHNPLYDLPSKYMYWV